MTQRVTQATGLGFIISRGSINSQHWRPDRHPANVGCSFFSYANDDLKNTTTRDLNAKHVLGKSTNRHYTAILVVTLHKEYIGKV